MHIDKALNHMEDAVESISKASSEISILLNSEEPGKYDFANCGYQARINLIVDIIRGIEDGLMDIRKMKTGWKPDDYELRIMYHEVSDILAQDGSDKDKEFMVTMYGYRGSWMWKGFLNGLAIGSALGSAITFTMMLV